MTDVPEQLYYARRNYFAEYNEYPTAAYLGRAEYGGLRSAVRDFESRPHGEPEQYGGMIIYKVLAESHLKVVG